MLDVLLQLSTAEMFADTEAKYINDTVWNLDESTQQLSTFNIIALLPYLYKPQASLNQQSSTLKIWNLGKGDILQLPP